MTSEEIKERMWAIYVDIYTFLKENGVDHEQCHTSARQIMLDYAMTIGSAAEYIQSADDVVYDEDDEIEEETDDGE